MSLTIMAVNPLAEKRLRITTYDYLKSTLGYNSVDGSRVYIHSIRLSCCLPYLQNHAKFRENSDLWHFEVIHGHRPFCQSEAHMEFLISD